MSVLEAISKREEKKIFLCHTMYHTLVALSIVLDNIDYDSCAIVIAPMRRPKDNIQNYSDLVNRIKKIGINVVLVDKGGIARRLFGISEVKNRKIFRDVLGLLKCRKHEYLMINMSWNKQVVVYPASLFFRYCKSAIFIEEGAQLWQTPKENVFYTYCLRLYGNQLNWWKDHKIDWVFAHDVGKLVELGVPKLKAKEFSLQQIIQTYDVNKKRKLCSLFIDEEVLYDLIENDKGHKCIVFTQPISEDAYVSESEKIHLYSDICSFYSQYGQVYLKKHPRDNSEYEIEKVTIIKDRFPSEVFSILGLHFYVAVGLCTSAIEEVLADYKQNIGPTYLADGKYNLVKLDGMDKSDFK